MGNKYSSPTEREDRDRCEFGKNPSEPKLRRCEFGGSKTYKVGPLLVINGVTHL